MNYNDIKLSIYESFDNGEIDELEKDILLERLEERYNEEDNNNEDITLEEVMDTISSYLSEKTAAVKKSFEIDNKIKEINEKINKLEELKRMYKSKKNEKMVSEIEDKIVKLKLDNMYYMRKETPLLNAKFAYTHGRDAAKSKAAGNPKDHSISKATGKLINSANSLRGNSKREPEVKGKYKTTNGLKESVDELRLDVYESYENGNITEEEKNMFLEYLNLDNYS